MYHPDGQLARANYGGNSEEFLWDGLALIRRNDEHFINEPHVGGGNPVVSSKDKSYFNDMLGTTVGFKTNGKYSAAALSAFGERLDNADGTSPAIRSLGEGWFTGKPFVEGLGHAFLMRNYRAGLAKWQSADPMGYPDGWNQMKYGVNNPSCGVDLLGCSWWNPFDWFGEKGEFIGTERHDVSGLSIVIMEIKLECGEAPPSKGFKWSTDAGKYTIKAKVNFFGVDFDLSYEAAPDIYEYCPEKYICSAKQHATDHDHKGIKTVRIKATPMVTVEVKKYWRKGADENTPEDERYVYVPEAIGKFWSYSTVTTTTNCKE